MTQTPWNLANTLALFELPFFQLVDRAYKTHQQSFGHSEVEFCTLSSIKTGACPEDCSYCPQSGHFKTGVEKEKLLDINLVLAQAKAAKASGAKRLCMGAAWRSPPKKDLPKVAEMIKAVKAMGLETCVTLGMLDQEQTQQLKEAGLDYYNHNIDSSEEFYSEIISTRTFQDRLDTLEHVMDADINVCCGGILGMGETREDRINMLLTLTKLKKPPKSIPINKLIAIPGTPLENAQAISEFEFIKTIAVTRILFPQAMVRLSAGRENMSDTMQAWCYMAGANSIFLGDKLLTAKNPGADEDSALFEHLGLTTPAEEAQKMKETKEAQACEHAC